ncbi:DUF1643 domain-containing protein [Streptococcus dentiloxodontae]
MLFIGLNPSTADETVDGPTIRRCISFGKSWGYGGLYMTNLFAYRSTDPINLWAVDDPIGDDNDYYILNYAEISDEIVACWGNSGFYQHRSKEISNLLEEIYCFGQNKSGEPEHPLYLKKIPHLLNINKGKNYVITGKNQSNPSFFRKQGD